MNELWWFIPSPTSKETSYYNEKFDLFPVVIRKQNNKRKGRALTVKALTHIDHDTIRVTISCKWLKKV